MAQENFSTELENLLVTRNFDVDASKDAQGNDANAEDAKVFSFDYVASSGRNYGRMVLVLQDGNTLLALFGDNLGRSMEDPVDKQEFLDFQQHLHDFAVRNFWKYSATDISKLKHVLRGMAAIKESLFESYYGNRRVSYMGAPTEARMVINHARMLGEHDRRYQYIDSIFIETVEGERYKMQFKNIAGAKAMLEHVRQGGRPYDVRGTHITEMVNEIAVLSRFRRASRSRVLEGASAELAAEADSFYAQLRETLRRMSSSTGYKTYFESWQPTETALHEELVDSIKTMFIEQTLDSRIEAALPLLARLRQNTMEEIKIFETWANNLVEGTWVLPDTPEKWQKLQELMSKPLMVGPGAINATEQLDDIVGDDQLFDRLQELAKEDANANCWDDTEVQTRLRELGVALNTTPLAMDEPTAPTASPAQTVTEARINEIAPLALAAPAAGAVARAAAPAVGRAVAQYAPRIIPQAEKFMGAAQQVGKNLLSSPAMTAGTRAPLPPASTGSLTQKIASGVGALTAGLGVPFAAMTQSGKSQQQPTATNVSTGASGFGVQNPDAAIGKPAIAPSTKSATPAAKSTTAPAVKPTTSGPAASTTSTLPAAPYGGSAARAMAAAPTTPTLPAAPYDGAAARAMAAPSTTPSNNASMGSAPTNTSSMTSQTSNSTAAQTTPAAPEGTTARLDQLKSNVAAGGANPSTSSVPEVPSLEPQKIDTTEGDNLNSFEEGVDDPINYNAAITGSYYESRSDDALLARIKSLALIK